MKVIIDISKLPCKNNKSCTDCLFYTGDICDVPTQLEKLPRLEEREWTPCSEKLPEKIGYYLVSDIYGNVYSSFFDYLKEKKCFVYDDDLYDLTEDDTVVAWKPLPEPYKMNKAE